MIITLTPNTGIDHTLQVNSFQLNDTIRATDSAWGMGGKAIDVSWTLGKLGIPTRALGFAAGPNGLRMESMLRERGVKTDFTWVDGESRLNTVLVVPGQGQSTITTSSLKVSADHVSEFFGRYQECLPGASCVVMGGSLPHGVPVDFFATAIDQAHQHQVPVILDSSGLSLLAGIRHQPDLIKPNRSELHDLLGYHPASQQEIHESAKRLCTEFNTNMIVTLGNDGAIAVFKDASFYIHPISSPVVSSAGAGDGVLAGMALAYSRKESMEYGLQHGCALASAILQTLATADFEVDAYQQLLPQIKITPL